MHSEESGAATNKVDGLSSQRPTLASGQHSYSFDGCTGSESPDVRTLSILLASVFNWDNLGVKLGLELCKVEEIKQRHNGNLEMCKSSVYDAWLRQNMDPSWKDVVNALEQIGENNLANKISQRYSIYFTESCEIHSSSPARNDSPAPNQKVMTRTSSTDSEARDVVQPASQEDSSRALIGLLKSMTIEDAQQIEIDCKVYNATTNQLIESTKAPLTRDIRVARHQHRVQEFSSDTVPIGTSIRIEVTTNSACYLYILNIGTSGKTALLLPNEYDSTNHFSPNETYHLPGPDFGFDIEGPPGKETVQIFAFSEKQATLEKLAEKPRELYRDIKCRRRNPTVQGFAQIQFDVQ